MVIILELSEMLEKDVTLRIKNQESCPTPLKAI